MEYCRKATGKFRLETRQRKTSRKSWKEGVEIEIQKSGLEEKAWRDGDAGELDIGRRITLDPDSYKMIFFVEVELLGKTSIFQTFFSTNKYKLALEKPPNCFSVPACFECHLF